MESEWKGGLSTRVLYGGEDGDAAQPRVPTGLSGLCGPITVCSERGSLLLQTLVSISAEWAWVNAIRSSFRTASLGRASRWGVARGGPRAEGRGLLGCSDFPLLPADPPCSPELETRPSRLPDGPTEREVGDRPGAAGAGIRTQVSHTG